MSKQDVLVVADRTADAPELVEVLRRRGAAGTACVTLLVPARRERLSPTDPEQEAWVSAMARAEAGVAAIRAAGIDCKGAIVADPDPLLATGDVLHVRRFDEVFVAAPPPVA